MNMERQEGAHTHAPKKSDDEKRHSALSVAEWLAVTTGNDGSDGEHRVLPQREQRQKKRKKRGEMRAEVPQHISRQSKDISSGEIQHKEYNDQLDVPWSEGGDETERKFEYLDHTADVQLHAWGGTLREAFEQVALCMFNYMTPLEGIEARDVKRFSMYGDDMDSLMFHWLDELLFTFSTEFFVPRKLRILEFDTKNWKIQAEGFGDTFDRTQHTSGTEIKAITYSAMQIYEGKEDKKSEVYVIVDI